MKNAALLQVCYALNLENVLFTPSFQFRSTMVYLSKESFSFGVFKQIYLSSGSFFYMCHDQENVDD